MRKSITVRAFPPGLNLLARAELARAAGFAGLEINLETDEEYTLEASGDKLRALRTQLDARGVAVSAVYSREQWQFPITSSDAAVRGRGQAIIERLIRAARDLGTDAVLVVPGAVDNGLFAAEPEIVPYDIAYANAQTALRELVSEAEKRHVYLALENVWNKFLLSPLEFAAFVDELDSSRVGVYLDVGNVLRTGFPEHWIRILNDRVRRVHFKDFRLSQDGSGGFVGLLEGDVNWPAVRNALAEVGYDSWVTAEVLPHYRYHGERLIYETSASMDAILEGGPASR